MSIEKIVKCTEDFCYFKNNNFYKFFNTCSTNKNECYYLDFCPCKHCLIKVTCLLSCRNLQNFTQVKNITLTIKDKNDK